MFNKKRITKLIENINISSNYEYGIGNNYIYVSDYRSNGYIYITNLKKFISNEKKYYHSNETINGTSMAYRHNNISAIMMSDCIDYCKLLINYLHINNDINKNLRQLGVASNT